LRDTTFGRRAQIIYIPELAGGHSIGHVWGYVCKKFRPKRHEIDAVFENARVIDGVKRPFGNPGLTTTPQWKNQCAEATKTHIVQGTVEIWDSLVVANPFIKNPKKRVSETFEIFERELRAYQVHDLTSDNPLSRTVPIVSGVIDKYGKVRRAYAFFFN